MKIVFIGAGNVATHLAKELYKYNFDIIQIYSKTLLSAQRLAKQVDSIPTNKTSDINANADLYIFSIKDAALPEILNQIPTNNGLWLHTAGSMPMSVFEDYTNYYGVLYPFQTFSKGCEIDWKSVPIFIEANSNKSLNILTKIAKQLSDKVTVIASDKRRFIHLTGVFACNFVNHMYTLSSAILNNADLPFEVALPLIDETTKKVHTVKPIEAQTGPAIRYDKNVMNMHLAMLEDENMKEIYRVMSDSIHKTSSNK